MGETTIRSEGMRAYPRGDLFVLTKSGGGFDTLADTGVTTVLQDGLAILHQSLIARRQRRPLEVSAS